MMEVTIYDDHALAEGHCSNCGQQFRNRLPLNGEHWMIECECGIGATTHRLTPDADDRIFST